MTRRGSTALDEMKTLPDPSSPYYLWAKQLADRKTRSTRAQPAASKSDWLKLPEAAPLLGVSAQTLQEWCRKRLIEHKREGTRGRGGRGTYFIHRDAIDAHNRAKIQKAIQPPQKTSVSTLVRQKRSKLRHLDPNWGKEET